ncbi:hypothetical protein SAMD00019534_050620 [Acytostelium subglobosum LB1]|uniref:hypothetical protein n=1 Tax=Acytostelium subglobosum LB1 TaxID=1410327 RepID=UPI000644F432|nr:hypothetical protein SAMD00019534_050620 [Acytostelium subglobosum LB1]GAM21887.1 hypothetical protein SAMD00019534_050620 [Acytostelium subglobosum LB1]|eukprot:XP_012754987.1 hypothetical protein SAMD00019534_050620 [Acytostelium subglobosum LB1]
MKDYWLKVLYSLFTLTAIGYLNAKRKSPNSLLRLLKPVPVVILAYVVLLWCSDDQQQHGSLTHLLWPHNPTAYSMYISVGLILSAFGDFFLLFKRYFVHGVIFFLVAHVAFIMAFTVETASLSSFFTPTIVLILISINVLFVMVFVLKVVPMFIKQTPNTVAIALFFYLMVILTMCYTASIRAFTKAVALAAVEDTAVDTHRTLTMYSLCAAVGAIVFFISDLMIMIRAMNDLQKNKVSNFRKFLGNGDVDKNSNSNSNNNKQRAYVVIDPSS